MKLHIPSRYAAVVAGGDTSSRFQDLFFQASLVVAADSGIYHLSSMDIVPHIFVGDFDSCTSETVEEFKRKGSRIVCLAREKSKTDTQVALEAVREWGYDTAALFGSTGGARFDHSLANMDLIEHFAERGLDVIAFTPGSIVAGMGYEIKTRAICAAAGTYVSLLPVTRKVTGVSTGQLKYPLKNATLTRGESLGISNEVIGPGAYVSVDKGFLLMIISSVSPGVVS